MPTDELENELRRTLARAAAEFPGLQQARQRLLQRDYHPQGGRRGLAAGLLPGRAAAAVAGLGRRRRRLALAGGLALALAAGVLSAEASGGSHPAVPAGLTALVTQRAAAAALAGPDVRPGQWVYWMQFLGSRAAASIRQGWQTADDQRMAVYQDGRLRLIDRGAFVRGALRQAGLGPVTSITYQALGTLPKHPAALVSYLEDLFTADPPAQRPGRAFAAISALFAQYLGVLPRDLAAELYHALAAIPGVTVDQHATDLAGQHVITLRYPGAGLLFRPGELLLSPHTYRFTGVQWFPQGSQPASAQILLRIALVPGPGIQP